MRARHQEGRAVACSHGHTIPAFAAYHVAVNGWDELAPLDFRTSRLSGRAYRGQWYRVRYQGQAVEVELVEVPDFPR
jgi:hypothetical protein